MRFILGLVCSLSVGVGCGTDRAAMRPADGPGQGGRRTSGYGVGMVDDDRANDDGLQVQAEHGFLSENDVEDTIRARWSQLTRCYEEAGTARDFAGGPVTLKFFADGRGAISEVRVLQSRLGNFDVERCLVNAGRAITFPRPQGGATSFEYTLEFRSSGELPVVDLASGDVERALPPLLPQLAAACQRLGADALSATLYLEPSGIVRSVGFAAPTTLDLDAAQCLSDEMRRWSLPVEGLRGMGRVTVALRSQDLLAPPEPPPTPPRRGRSPSAPRAPRGAAKR